MENEKLMNMTREELVMCVKELHAENESLKSDIDMWCKSYSNLRNKFERFRDAIKSIVQIVD